MHTDTPALSDTREATVLLVDDHPIVRHGLARMIQQEEGLTVCGEAGNGAEAMEAIAALDPDIVLVDLVLDDESGVDLIEQIRGRWRDLPVLVITMHDAADYLKRAFQAGAQGFVNKKEAVNKLSVAIKRVLAGGIYIGEEMMTQVAHALVPNAEPQRSSPVGELTEREIEILEFVGQGYRPRHIAERLSLSPKTVNSHRENIKKKLSLRTAADLDQFAIKWYQERSGL